MLVGACGRRLGDPVATLAGKRRVVKKRDEADDQKSVSSRLLFSSMAVAKGLRTALGDR